VSGKTASGAPQQKITLKKSSPSKKEERIEGENYAEFMKEEMRFEEAMRFDQSKIENLQKLQQI